MNDELYHHGVLGMKWGVRNAETKARYSRDGKKVNKLLKSNTKQEKKVSKYSNTIKKHRHRPAITFDYANGFNLVFGARASSIRHMKLMELQDKAEYKTEKNNRRINKIISQTADKSLKNIKTKPFKRIENW